MSLFGNLFDENGNDSDDEDESASEFVTSGADCSVSNSVKPDEKPDATEPAKPAAVRPEHGLCGILNLGATCYLNSLLQVRLGSPQLIHISIHTNTLLRFFLSPQK